MITATPADKFDARQLPEVDPPVGRLTATEVGAAGDALTRLHILKAMKARPDKAQLETAGATLFLSPTELEAVVSLLVERFENVLHLLDIHIDREGSN